MPTQSAQHSRGSSTVAQVVKSSTGVAQQRMGSSFGPTRSTVPMPGMQRTTRTGQENVPPVQGIRRPAMQGAVLGQPPHVAGIAQSAAFLGRGRSSSPAGNVTLQSARRNVGASVGGAPPPTMRAPAPHYG